MNEVARVSSNAVAVADDYNPFLRYAKEAARKTIVGKLLKFQKGDYVAGQDGEVINEGTKFIANMDQLLIGWQRWSNSKPQEQIMGLLTEGFVLPKRDELSHQDESQWEIDDNGKPQDPWQETNYLVLMDPDPALSVENSLYTFTTSSRGGLGAILELCDKYGKGMRSHPGQYPTIAIKVRKYKHEKYGWIKTPSFEIIGWAPKGIFDGAQTEEVDSPSIVPGKTQF